MQQVVSMVEARSRLAELVDQVKFGGRQYILTRRGRPMAILISIEEKGDDFWLEIEEAR